MDNSNRFKVRLESYSHGTSNTPTSAVTFAVQPVLSQSISVEYQALDPIHMPGSFYTYRGTKSSQFSLSEIKLISRNSQEASDNQAIVNILRGWTKPYFGFGTANGSSSPTVQQDYSYEKVNSDGTTSALTQADISQILSTQGGNPGKLTSSNVNTTSLFGKQSIESQVKTYLSALDANSAYQANAANQKYKRIAKDTTTLVSQSGKRFLGAPPEVLYLTAYSDAINNGGSLDNFNSGMLDKFNNITRIPVVISQIDLSYPNDCDYIPTKQGMPFPVVFPISMTLMETHSPREFETFDIFKYREGRLPGF